MYTFECTIRTRYSETDAMGVIYHANYINYYEIARTMMLNSSGIYSYKQMEKDGIMMPVIEVNTKYIQPAYYDEDLTIKVFVKNMPTSRMVFDYEITNEKGELINTGFATLAFMNSETRRPCRPPLKLVEILKPYFI